MGKKTKKKGIRATIREFFQVIHLALNYLFSFFLLLLFLGFFAVPFDPIPFVDEILFGYLLYVSISVILEKVNMPAQQREIARVQVKKQRGLRQYEDKMRRIFTLFKEIKKSLLKYKKSTFLKAEGERFNSLLPKVKKIKAKIESLDKILQKPDFQEAQLESELIRLSEDISRVDSDQEKEELTAARSSAEKCLTTVKNLTNDRNTLVARLDKFYYLLKETHSKIVAMDLSEAELAEDVSKDINRLLESIDSFDQAMKELGTEVTSPDPVLDDLALPGDESPPKRELDLE
jgi:hypothetical protein